MSGGEGGWGAWGVRDQVRVKDRRCLDDDSEMLTGQVLICYTSLQSTSQPLILVPDASHLSNS
jgi:hypothetical protein